MFKFKTISKTFVCVCGCGYIFKWSSNRWQQNWKETIIYLMVLLCVCAYTIFNWTPYSLSLFLFFSVVSKADIDFCLWYALITSNKSTFRARASSITYILLYSMLCMDVLFLHACEYVHSYPSRAQFVRQSVRQAGRFNRPIESVNLAGMKYESKNTMFAHKYCQPSTCSQFGVWLQSKANVYRHLTTKKPNTFEKTVYPFKRSMDGWNDRSIDRIQENWIRITQQKKESHSYYTIIHFSNTCAFKWKEYKKRRNKQTKTKTKRTVKRNHNYQIV